MPRPAAAKLLIREVQPQDAEAVALLCTELGYPATAQDVERRLQTIGHPIFVAVDDVVIGWIEVAVIDHVASEPMAEITGLVVSAERRGSGVGKQLVERAETWAREQGLRRMRVRSRAAREDAHRFYMREGYQVSKTQVVFDKVLAGDKR